MNQHTRIILFFTLLIAIMPALGQQSIRNYETEWKKVDNFIGKGLPQSALTEVDKIYALAKKEKQDAQIIKALVKRLSLQGELREDDRQYTVRSLQEEISAAKEPARSVLYAILADAYRNQYQSMRWQIMSRTNVPGARSSDTETWTTADFMEAIGESYLKSIANETVLKSTKLEPLDAIITKGNTRSLRPTLFDLLAHKALDFFENDERNVTKPAYAFELGQPEVFADAAAFSNFEFRTKDTLSLDYQALGIYQRLLKFHLKDAKPAALLDADIRRLGYVYRKSVHPDRDALYQEALKNIAQKYRSEPGSAQASYLLAQWYVQKAGEYQPFGDTSHRFSAVTAYKIADSVSKKHPDSEGGINLFNLKQSIVIPQLSFNVEKVNLPDQPILMLLSYKNSQKANFRLVKATGRLREIEQKEGQARLWQVLKSEPALRTWEQALPDTKDYQHHRVELKVDPLGIGTYYLTASGGTGAGTPQSIARLSVSNLSFVNRGADYFVRHRDSGAPLEGIQVQVWRQRYDNTTHSYKREKAGTFKTDADGYFSLQHDSSTSGGGTFLELSGKGDHLLIDDQQYLYTNREPGISNDIQTMFFFTDRSIYRPGQEVHFKGILLNKKAGESRSSIVVSKPVTVQLFDVNGQVTDTLDITTNEFGTVSGKFLLPVTGLTGNFRIEAKQIGGAAAFSVEDYKRPRYKVEIEKPAIGVKLAETIPVSGQAKAFAGNPIDGAIVKYRVERAVRFPYPWRFAKGWWPVSPPVQITGGETVTDAEGRFTISFQAIPDKSVSPDKDPVFDYVVYADVTDAAGETRSARQVVSAGYKPMVLKVNIPEKAERDSLATLAVRTENANGGFLPANVTLTVRKLVPESRLLRQRQWERPDQFVLARADFVKLFPLDEYDDEANPASWQKGEEVLKVSREMNESGKWPLANTELPAAGFYELEFVTTAPDGQEVKDVRRIEVVDSKEEKPGRPAFLWTRESKPVAPGGNAVIQLGTSAEKIYLIQLVDKMNGNRRKGSRTFPTQEKGVETYRFPVTEDDRGGYGVDFVFVRNNRVYQHHEKVSVPSDDKELKITYGTFRDKTLPGSQEKWTLTVAGAKGERVAAELLAAMYDASLDEFRGHQWEKPVVWPGYYPLQFWAFNGSFGTRFSQPVSDGGPRSYRNFEKRYDVLNSLDGFGGGMMVRNMVTGKAARGGVIAESRSESMMAAPMEQGIAADATSKKVEYSKDFSGREEAQNQVSGDQPTRKDFRETAFFYPDLRVSDDGSVTFSFTMPEALTRWKFQAFAHTKELAFGLSTKEIVTQKELMIQPNIPRFLRVGDQLSIAARFVNLSDKPLSGKAEISILDAATGASLNGKFGTGTSETTFSVAAGQSSAVSFPLTVPVESTEPVVIRLIAVAGDFQDGEEHTVSVLTNQMLATETLPLSMRGTGSKSYTLEKLVRSKPGGTLRNHALTVEYTGNPVWYAVQALPYLMEYPYDCAEQTWNRYYANALSRHLVTSSPRIEQVFKTWRDLDTSALLSNLQKNQELKALLLEETPWVLAAKSEAEQKRNLALLFDLVRMKSEAAGALLKLQKMQRPEGSFPWFAEGPDDRYVTQYILSGIGHLGKLAKPSGDDEQVLSQVIARGLSYLDSRITRDYREMVERKVDLKKYVPSPLIVQYLYMRSFFPQVEFASGTKKAHDYFVERLAASWTGQGKYLQAMTALALSRTGNKTVAAAIMKSLKETAIRSEELGTYWKSARRTWWWQDAPVEQHALLIEAFEEVAADREMADGIRGWLLANKRTNSWESTKATAEACYALLLGGSDWLNDNPVVTVVMGDRTLSSADGKEAGTGYMKTSIPGEEVNAGQGNIKLSVSGSETVKGRPSWGGVYWQYFENLDKITFSETPLKMKKKLYTRENSDRGPVLKELAAGNRVKVGDKLTVRIELSVDRDMEYVHMKDMRGAGLEPVNVLSSNKWQDGLAYYESTRDAATHFFFSYLPKGTYVFEYPLTVSHQGNFSNGVTTIQCMYAPEFTAHSEGIRLTVE
ncbi:alpha-2-macroglobulin family protein [Ravibacter arvi]|uniref:Alpha-2-macroglobulin family protein n=1 Tax=Ravibacter arvi TaxID=2051041 RepID=A0ABP8M9H3_9BACT